MRIAIVTTLDTKGLEAAYVAGLLRQYGAETVVIDVGVIGTPEAPADITRDQVAQAAGTTIDALRPKRRDEIMAIMGQGAGHILADMLAKGQLQGVLALGGNQGTAIAAIALQQLPIGLPKLIVSTVASGNIRPYIGHKDITMMFSVADLVGGPNMVSRTILANAAGAIWGMARSTVPIAPPMQRPVVAITAFGNTNAAVTRARAALVEHGYEVLVFHASGACGSAMEELISQGKIHGVLDITPHEIIGDIFGDDIYAPTSGHRLVAAGQAGIPQVVGTGGLDYFCFGPPESIPAKYRGRPTHYHNPYNTNVRTIVSEMTLVGEVMAQRLNAAKGPVTVLIPTKGWSMVGSPGGPLYDPEANAAFVQALLDNIRPPVEVHQLDCTINDPIYADTAVEILHKYMEVTLWKSPKP